MLLRIEKGSAVPISRQIGEQIATLCASGSLRPGERLPSVRELARELAVNQNTILRVYERLVGEGLLEMRHGQGTFVAAKALRGQLAVHRERLVDELRQIARQAAGLGFRRMSCTSCWPRRRTASFGRRRWARVRVTNHERSGDELQAVRKSFGSKEVLRGVTFRVERGKTFAFLGRNGAGKTTTIRMLLGLLGRDDGSIRVLGLDPTLEPIELRKRVGYLAEDQTMYGWMRVEEILLFLKPFYPTWDQELALRYVRDFELPLTTKIKHLSKGQNVRLGLVLALAHRPELVILDDPALGLDPIMRKQFNRDLITHLQGEGRTLFYSSHLLYEVEPVADEVAILDDGRILRQADTETLRRDVKQLIMRQDLYPVVRHELKLLDERYDGGRVVAIVEQAEQAIAALGREASSTKS